MNIQGVSAVGTGASLDAPGQAAMLVFIPRGGSASSIPAEINGVRTRVVESDSNLRGSLNQTQTAQLAAVVAQTGLSLTDQQVAQTDAVKNAHLAELRAHAAVQASESAPASIRRANRPS